MLKIETITARADFAALEHEWDELLPRSASDTVTLTHPWLLTWWDVFGEGRELMLLTARENGRLVGIAPLLRRRVRNFGVAMTRIEFLASGEDEADEICSDYLDFILENGREREVLGAFTMFLEREKSWDELILTDIAGQSPNVAILRELGGQKGWSFAVAREQVCIFTPLPDSHEAFVASLGGQIRKRIRKDRAILLREAEKQDLRVEMTDSPAGFERAFAALVGLHQERWTSQGFPGSFSSAKFTRFHRELAPLMIARGHLKVWVLWQEDAPLSAVYDFVYGGKIFYYQSGMRGKSSPILSPGVLIRDCALEAAIAQGLTECDFLKGEISGYKMGWGGQTRPILQLRLARRSRKEAMFQALSRAVEWLRPVRRRLRKRWERLRGAKN